METKCVICWCYLVSKEKSFYLFSKLYPDALRAKYPKYNFLLIGEINVNGLEIY